VGEHAGRTARTRGRSVAERAPASPQPKLPTRSEAENKSPRTVEAYTDAVRFLALYCEAHGKPLLARQLRREHIQDFIADQLARWKPATATTATGVSTPSSSGR
jgi:hypothetical protein